MSASASKHGLSRPIIYTGAFLFAVMISLVFAGYLNATPGNGGGADKVEVCHLPPGNPANYKTIKVSVNAVPDHLGHGEFEGNCDSDEYGVRNDLNNYVSVNKQYFNRSNKQ